MENRIRRQLRCGLGLLLLLGATAIILPGCGAVASYPLSVTGSAGPTYFTAIATCAGESKLQFVRHPGSINVAFDGATWVQFTVQGDAFNMVITVDGSVAEEQRAARVTQARAKGDEIFACALKVGPSEVPVVAASAEAGDVATSAPSAEPTTAPTAAASSAPSTAPTSSAGQAPQAPTYPRAVCAKSTKACERDSQCGIEHCSENLCYPGNDGCPCSRSTHCGAGLHCGAGYCYPGKAGTPCDGVDSGQCGSGNHCTKGICHSNAKGSACDFKEQCGLESSCVKGVCN